MTFWSMIIVPSALLSLPSDPEIGESQPTHLLGLVEVSAIEDDRIRHQGLDPFEIGLTKRAPLRAHRQCVSTLDGFVVVGAQGHAREPCQGPASRLRRHRVEGANLDPGLSEA